MARLAGRINIQAGVRAVERRQRRALLLALEHLLQVSRSLAPHEEGVLERSGRVEIQSDGSRGAVTYDTPYAVRQHEELSWQHDPGRQAKYLEQPMRTERAVMIAIVQRELARGLR